MNEFILWVADLICKLGFQFNDAGAWLNRRADALACVAYGRMGSAK